MAVDFKKVNIILRAAKTLIESSGIEKELNEEKIADVLKKAAIFTGATLSNEEAEAAKRDLQYQYQVYSAPGQSILDDYDQELWYDDVKGDIEPKFWNRYRDYLIDSQNFSPNVVNILGDDTIDKKLMNCLGDPNSSKPFLRRGLIIGDVQSGKTSTYIGLMCKAADAGYKVFILLTGTIESLRRQTQERVEEGFVGIDMTADTSGGKRVGVGLDNKPLFAKAMTSRIQDFTGNIDKIADTLAGNNNAIVFVIKKNTTSLKKLKNWLVSLNADPVTKKIDQPMVLIDDEADNASINTSGDSENPTVINRMIRELASVFTKSNYVGFTATPFANVFIDPITTEEMTTQDLFPENFIVTLPTPSNYVGPKNIFDKDGKHYGQLVPVTDAGCVEDDGKSFYYKHKKEWRGDLPESLTDSIYAFFIVNTIRDLRGDEDKHRSMLINISRFVAVQKYIKDCVDDIYTKAYRAVKHNLTGAASDLKDPILKRIHEVFEDQFTNAGVTWHDVAKNMFKAIEKIKICIVNSSKNSEKLVYPKNDPQRVIAIGGLALSRGLTLEGLIISYFYRNTSTYDVLMQMGRWFGYRRNYEDLFRIWIAESSAEWYAEISEATEALKIDMELMRDLKLKPKDFGIRVRNNSSELNITSYNKMRNTSTEYETESYFGGCVETPYLPTNYAAIKQNFDAVTNLVNGLQSMGKYFVKQGNENYKERYLVKDVDKSDVTHFLSKLSISQYSVKFDSVQLVDFLNSCTDSSIDKFDVAFMEGETGSIDIAGLSLKKVLRNNSSIDPIKAKLSVGQRGKLAGTSDGKIGIDCLETIEQAKSEFKKQNPTKSEHYPVDTWFKYVENRNPLLLIYPLELGMGNQEQNPSFKNLKDQIEKDDIVFLGFMIGFPKNESQASMSVNKYKVNTAYNYFDRDVNENEEEE